jgi:hypothetical protein
VDLQVERVQHCAGALGHRTGETRFQSLFENGVRIKVKRNNLTGSIDAPPAS